MVAVHHARALDQDLVVVAELDLAAGEHRADGAELVLVGVVDEGAGRGLGEPVALEDQDAGGVEPLGDVLVEGRGAGDEEADPAAEPVADLAEHQPVEQRVLDLQRQRDRLALGLEPVDLEADLERLVEDLLLGAALGLLHGDDPAVGLLEDARRGTHERRLHDAEVVDDLVDPAVDGGREAAGELGGEQHLAERVRHRQPQELQVALVEDVLGVDRLALVDPRAVPEPDALRPAGRAGRVDQRGQLVGLDGLGRLLDHAGVLGEVVVAELAEVVEPDHPVAVGLAGERDHLLQVRQLVLVLGDLGDLLVVLGEDDPALRVAEDVAGVLGVGRRVDGGRGAAGAHDGEVGQDPLVAGAEAMPTRCSDSMPSASRPAASRATSSPACFQVTDVHDSPSG